MVTCKATYSNLTFCTSLKLFILVKNYLLNSRNWINHITFNDGELQDLGIYKNWTAADIIRDRTAKYKQIPSDFCLMQILAQNCYVSSFCKEMMLSSRIDKGYLLTHRYVLLRSKIA